MKIETAIEAVKRLCDAGIPEGKWKNWHHVFITRRGVDFRILAGRWSHFNDEIENTSPRPLSDCGEPVGWALYRSWLEQEGYL